VSTRRPAHPLRKKTKKRKRKRKRRRRRKTTPKLRRLRKAVAIQAEWENISRRRALHWAPACSLCARLHRLPRPHGTCRCRLAPRRRPSPSRACPDQSLVGPGDRCRLGLVGRGRRGAGRANRHSSRLPPSPASRTPKTPSATRWRCQPGRPRQTRARRPRESPSKRLQTCWLVANGQLTNKKM
jgi:hypothetical protein